MGVCGVVVWVCVGVYGVLAVLKAHFRLFMVSIGVLYG